MSQNEDFVSFEKALRDLKMQSEELKKLVSEGEIRAFRDGESMKFRREDLDALRTDSEEELIFADTLEDDTGMVTEELSDEDTLLADDDLLEGDEEEDEDYSAASAIPSASRTTRARVAEEEESSEPGWVTAIAVVGAIVMVYGFMLAYKIAMETPPSGLTSLWAPN